MDTEQNMKQNLIFSRELCCREAKNIIFCKISKFLAVYQILQKIPRVQNRRILKGLLY